MKLKTFERRVDYEIAYVRIDTENSAEVLAEALRQFGVEGATWTVEPSYIVLSRQMGTVEVPAVEQEKP